MLIIVGQAGAAVIYVEAKPRWPPTEKPQAAGSVPPNLRLYVQQSLKKL